MAKRWKMRQTFRNTLTSNPLANNHDPFNLLPNGGYCTLSRYRWYWESEDMCRVEFRMEVAIRHEIEILLVPLGLFPDLLEAPIHWKDWHRFRGRGSCYYSWILLLEFAVCSETSYVRGSHWEGSKTVTPFLMYVDEVIKGPSSQFCILSVSFEISSHDQARFLVLWSTSSCHAPDQRTEPIEEPI